MPTFYFDIDDGTRRTRDQDGVEFPDRDLARRAAIEVLPDLAREAMRDGEHDISIVVLNESRRPIFAAKLSLVATWLDAAQT